MTDSTTTAGYSGTPLPKKLGIKQAMRVALLHAPENIEEILGELPPDVELVFRLGKKDQVDLIVVFIVDRDHLERNIGWITKTLPPAGALWVAWPKKASKVPTDLTEDVVREIALPIGWVDVKVCAIDEIWSGLKLVLRKELRP